ncbi:RHS repeat-associated core domain-containing protein [Celerinatantimonas sp. YJH-8]|uniref:RHS repeat-associated core domain-containing protein n=1 Tax=Celerinatantimonas sp. YJH-8 TaxID=3228714 RepID=UPI0038C6EDB7
MQKEKRQYDNAGRVVKVGRFTYQYDACGRAVSKTEQKDGFRPQITRFNWDEQDRLTRIELPNGERWRYRYDAFGRRLSKECEQGAQSKREIEYRYDGAQVVQQILKAANGDALQTTEYIYEPGSFRPVAQVNTNHVHESEQLHYVITDQAGTPRELCSEDGDIVWRGEQGLWQRHRQQQLKLNVERQFDEAANDPVQCDLRYQGQLEDCESGLYYNLNRYYDADSGQYLSPDPIGMAGGLRPQAYVHNPMEWVDPLGLSEEGCKDAIDSGITALQPLPEFSNPQKAFEHYAKHTKGVVLGKKGKMKVKVGGADMPEFESLDDYLGAARSFWAPNARSGIVQGTRADGSILRFEPSSGYFGVMRNGKINTFFRPDGDAAARLKYFEEQL